jgi:hypothetical protein
MESQTFSSVGKNTFPITAAMVMLGSLAALPPLQHGQANARPAPDYSIAASQLSSGGFMGIVNKNGSTRSSIDSNQVPFGFQGVPNAESFATPFFQGLQFIQQIAFIGVDCEVDKAIDAHFSSRTVKTKKLFVNPYIKQA